MTALATTSTKQVQRIVIIIYFQAPVDLCILDLDIKEFSSYELFLKIRRKYFPNELPIMFIVSDANRHDEKVSIKIGGNYQLDTGGK